MKENYYKILNISESASKNEIDIAYRKLVMQYHPDRIKNEQEKQKAEEKLKQINQAYDVIGNEKKRKEYDQYLRYGASNNNGFSNYGDNNSNSFFEDFSFGSFDDIGNIFKQFFDFETEGFRNNRSNSASSKIISLSIPIDEWYQGSSQNISYDRLVKCTNCKNSKKECKKCRGQGKVDTILRRGTICNLCQGRGYSEQRHSCTTCTNGSLNKKENISIQIPAFADKVLNLMGYGNYSESGYGDLNIKLSIKEDKRYVINGADVFVTVPIGIEEFIYGSVIKFKYLDGRIINLNIKPLNVEMIVEKGKGIILNGQRGNLYINRSILRNATLPTKQKFTENYNIKNIESNFFKRE